MSDRQPLSENYFSAEAAVADLVRTVPGLKTVQVFTDYEQALKRLADETPAAFVYYEGDDPIRTDIDRTGSALSVQNIFVGVLDRTNNTELDDAGHRERIGPVLAHLRRLLPGQRIVPRSNPLSLSQGPVRRRLPGGGIVYVFHMKLSTPITPLATQS